MILDWGDDRILTTTGFNLILVLMLNFFSEKFCHFFGHFFRAQEIPHLSVINFMMKPPNPAQKFLQNILFKTENY